MWCIDRCKFFTCRFGHGCFLHCLESLYKKITGYDLKYTALVGKPSEITYHYAERVLQREAARMNLPRLRRMYCIGLVFVICDFYVHCMFFILQYVVFYYLLHDGRTVLTLSLIHI